jgi:AcrR family transcriptional regulator
LPELILASARELFLDQGFANTSLQQIAARAASPSARCT